MAVSEHLFPTATHAREGLILSQQESQPVMSTLQCGVERERKGKTTPGMLDKEYKMERHQGSGKGTKLRTGTQGKQRLTPPGVFS